MASDSASRIYEEASAYLRDLIRQHLDRARMLRLELAGEMDAMDLTLSLLERLPALIADASDPAPEWLRRKLNELQRDDG